MLLHSVGLLNTRNLTTGINSLLSDMAGLGRRTRVATLVDSLFLVSWCLGFFIHRNLCLSLFINWPGPLVSRDCHWGTIINRRGDLLSFVNRSSDEAPLVYRRPSPLINWWLVRRSLVDRRLRLCPLLWCWASDLNSCRIVNHGLGLVNYMLARRWG